VSADDVLEMATIHAAKALGLENEIGSLETGKKADFVALDPGGLHCTPFDALQLREGGIDPVTTVVYSCTGADVEMVVVDGQVLVQNHKLAHADENEISEQARVAVKRIRESSGVNVKQTRNWR